MDSDIAIELAADILEDHFGHAPKRVGVALLERGQLSLQNLVRFVNQDCSVAEDRLRFIEVRNILAIFVQHGLVVVKSWLPSEADSSLGIPQLYSMCLDEVLARLRFSHYCEYVLWTFGEVAWQVLIIVLQFGRVARNVLMAEVQKKMKDVSPGVFNADLQGLLDVGLLCPVSPFMASATKMEEDEQSVRPVVGGQKRKRSDDDKLRQPQPPIAQRRVQDIVYTFNRVALNLCLVKMLLCRVIEERTNQPYAGKVLSALLTAVRPAASGKRVESQYMTIRDVEAMMKEMGHLEGRGQKHEDDRLIHYLNLLGPDSAQRGGEEEGVRLLRRRTQRSMNVPGKLGAPGEEVAWAVDWTYASKTLMNSVTSHLVRDQFGPNGFRVFNLLNDRTPPQKLEESQVFTECMLPIEEGRDLLKKMIRRHMVQWQEVAKSQASRGDQLYYGSFWLYYVDRKHVEMSIMHDVLQAILNLRVRFRAEVERTVHLEGRPKSLTSGERATLLNSYRSQDILERSFLVLDSVVLVFRHFGV